MSRKELESLFGTDKPPVLFDSMKRIPSYEPDQSPFIKRVSLADIRKFKAVVDEAVRFNYVIMPDGDLILSQTYSELMPIQGFDKIKKYEGIYKQLQQNNPSVIFNFKYKGKDYISYTHSRARGTDLVLLDSYTGKPKGKLISLRHSDLAGGAPVVAAGEFYVKNGCIVENCQKTRRIAGINNTAFEFKCRGQHLPKLVETVFKRHGFTEATNLFKAKDWDYSIPDNRIPFDTKITVSTISRRPPPAYKIDIPRSFSFQQPQARFFLRQFSRLPVNLMHLALTGLHIRDNYRIEREFAELHPELGISPVNSGVQAFEQAGMEIGFHMQLARALGPWAVPFYVVALADPFLPNFPQHVMGGAQHELDLIHQMDHEGVPVLERAARLQLQRWESPRQDPDVVGLIAAAQLFVRSVGSIPSGARWLRHQASLWMENPSSSSLAGVADQVAIWMNQRRNIRPSQPLEYGTRHSLMGDMQNVLEMLQPTRGPQELSTPFLHNGVMYHYRIPGVGYAETLNAAEKGIDAFGQLDQQAQAQICEGTQRSLLMLYSESGSHEWGISPALRQKIRENAFNQGDLPNMGMCAGAFIHINTRDDHMLDSLTSLGGHYSELHSQVERSNPFSQNVPRLFEIPQSVEIPVTSNHIESTVPTSELELADQERVTDMQVQLESFFDRPEIASAIAQVAQGNLEQQVPQIQPINHNQNAIAFGVPHGALAIPQEIQGVLADIGSMTEENMVAINSAIEESSATKDEGKTKAEEVTTAETLEKAKMQRPRQHQRHNMDDKKPKPPVLSDFKLAMVEGMPGIEATVFDGSTIGIGLTATGFVIKVTATFGPAFWSTLLTGIGVGAGFGAILGGITFLRAYTHKKKFNQALDRIHDTERDCDALGIDLQALLQKMNSYEISLDAKLTSIDRQIARCRDYQHHIRGRSVTDRTKVCYEFSEAQESAARAVQEKVGQLYGLKDSVIFDDTKRQMQASLPNMTPEQLQARCAELEKANGSVLSPAQLAEIDVLRGEVLSRAYLLMQEGNIGLQQAINLMDGGKRVFFHLVPDIQEIRWHDQSGFGTLSKKDRANIARYNTAVRQLRADLAGGIKPQRAYEKFFSVSHPLEAEWYQDFKKREHDEQTHSGYEVGKRDERTVYKVDREARYQWIQQQNNLARQQKQELKGNPRRTFEVEGVAEELRSIQVLRTATDEEVVSAYVTNTASIESGEKTETCDIFANKGMRDIIMERVMTRAYNGEFQESLRLISAYRKAERESDAAHNEKVESTIQDIFAHRDEDQEYFLESLGENSSVKKQENQTPDEGLNYQLARLKVSAAHDGLDRALNALLVQGDLDASANLLEAEKARDPGVTNEVDTQLAVIMRLSADEGEGFEYWSQVHENVMGSEAVYLAQFEALDHDDSQEDDVVNQSLEARLSEHDWLSSLESRRRLLDYEVGSEQQEGNSAQQDSRPQSTDGAAKPERSSMLAFKVERLYAFKRRLDGAKTVAERGQFKRARDQARKAIEEEPYVQGGDLHKIPQQYNAQFEIQIIGAFLGPMMQHFAESVDYIENDQDRWMVQKFISSYRLVNTIFPQLPEMAVKTFLSHLMLLDDVSIVHGMMYKYLSETGGEFLSAAGTWSSAPFVPTSLLWNMLRHPATTSQTALAAIGSSYSVVNAQMLENGIFDFMRIQRESAMDGLRLYSPRLQAHLSIAQLSLMALSNAPIDYLPYFMQNRAESMRNYIVPKGQAALMSVQFGNALFQLYETHRFKALTATPSSALHANLIISVVLEGGFGFYNRRNGDGYLPTNTETYSFQSGLKFGVDALASLAFVGAATDGIGLIPMAMIALRGYFHREQVLSGRAHYYSTKSAISAALSNIKYWNSKVAEAGEGIDTTEFESEMYKNWDQVCNLLSNVTTPEHQRSAPGALAYGDDDFINAARIGYMGSQLIRKYDRLITAFNDSLSSGDEKPDAIYDVQPTYKIQIVNQDLQAEQEAIIDEMLDLTSWHDDNTITAGRYPAYMALDIIRFRLLAIAFSPDRIHEFPQEYQSAVDAVEATMTGKWRYDNFDRCREMFKSTVVALFSGVIRMAHSVYFPELLPEAAQQLQQVEFNACIDLQKEKLKTLLTLLEKVYKYVADPWDVILNDSQKIALAQHYMRLGKLNKSRQVLRAIINWSQFFVVDQAQSNQGLSPTDSHEQEQSTAARQSESRGHEIIQFLSAIDPNLTRQVVSGNSEAQSEEMLYSYITALIKSQSWDEASEAIETHQLSNVDIYKFYIQYIHYTKGEVVTINELLERMVAVPQAARDLTYWDFVERVVVDLLVAVYHAPRLNVQSFIACQIVRLCVLQKQLGRASSAEVSEAIDEKIDEVSRSLLINLGHIGLRDKEVGINDTQRQILSDRIEEATRVMNGHTDADIFRKLVEIYSNSLYSANGYSFVARNTPNDGESIFHCLGVTRKEALTKLKAAVRPSGLGMRFLWGQQQQREVIDMLIEHMERVDKSFSRNGQPEAETISLVLAFIDSHAPVGHVIDFHHGGVGLLDAIAYVYKYNLQVYDANEEGVMTLCNNNLYHKEDHMKLSVLVKHRDTVEPNHFIDLRTIAMPIQEVQEQPEELQVPLPVSVREHKKSLAPDHGWFTCSSQRLKDFCVGDNGISAVYTTQYSNWLIKGTTYNSVVTLQCNGAKVTDFTMRTILSYHYDTRHSVERSHRQYTSCTYGYKGQGAPKLDKESKEDTVSIRQAIPNYSSAHAKFNRSGRYSLIWGNGDGFVCDNGQVINRFSLESSSVAHMAFSATSDCFYVVFKQKDTGAFHLNAYRLNSRNAELGSWCLNDFVQDVSAKRLEHAIHFVTGSESIVIYDHHRVIHLTYGNSQSNKAPVIYPMDDMGDARCFPLKDGQHVKIMRHQFVFFDPRRKQESLVKYKAVQNATFFQVDADKSRIVIANDCGDVCIFKY